MKILSEIEDLNNEILIDELNMDGITQNTFEIIKIEFNKEIKELRILVQ